tara:strand:- start:192 stop:347 length:156 start_codon:yes stop_codon:yes gene_type:complete
MKLVADWLWLVPDRTAAKKAPFRKSLLIKLVVGVGFEPTNAEAGGFTVRIL